MPSFRRVLFLDIDGVLNSYGVSGYRLDGYKGEHPDRIKDLSPLLVARLNRLMDAVPDVDIVLSSTWRRHHTPAEVEELLRFRGFRFKIAGRTGFREEVHASSIMDQRYGFRDELPRGWYIKLWLRQHPEVETFAVLDDMGPGQFLDVWGRTVRTKIGFKPRDDMLRESQIDTTIRLLNDPFPVHPAPRVWSDAHGDWGPPAEANLRTYDTVAFLEDRKWQPLALGEQPVGVGAFVLTWFRDRLHVCKVTHFQGPFPQASPVEFPEVVADLYPNEEATSWVRGPWLGRGDADARSSPGREKAYQRVREEVADLAWGAWDPERGQRCRQYDKELQRWVPGFKPVPYTPEELLRAGVAYEEGFRALVLYTSHSYNASGWRRPFVKLSPEGSEKRRRVGQERINRMTRRWAILCGRYMDGRPDQEVVHTFEDGKQLVRGSTDFINGYENEHPGNSRAIGPFPRVRRKDGPGVQFP